MQFCVPVCTQRRFGPGGDGTQLNFSSGTCSWEGQSDQSTCMMQMCCILIASALCTPACLHQAYARVLKAHPWPCGRTWGGIDNVVAHCTLSMWKASAASKYVGRARFLLWINALLSRLAVPLSPSIQPSCSVFSPFGFSGRPVDVNISDDSRIHEGHIASTTLSDPSTCSFGFHFRRNGRSNRVREGP